MAQPTPPPTTHTRFTPSSMWVGTPRGPTKSLMSSPTFRSPSSMVVSPTFWKMMVMVPFSRS